MRAITALVVVSAVLAVAYGSGASCLVHCNRGGDCGCPASEGCQGVYCEAGCGTPCPSCTGSGMPAGALYGDCLYGNGVPDEFVAAECSGSGYCGYCECDMVNGYDHDYLDECCQYDCSLCEVAGCPAEKVTCLADCVPEGDGEDDYTNCCFCDCDDGNACTINAWDYETQECTTEPACPPETCNEPECVPTSEGFSCVDRLLSNTECVDDENKCLVGTCLNGECLELKDRDCGDQNDCTADSCDDGTGCVNDPVADGTECDDKSACTGGDTCSAGKCEGSDLCQEDEVCTESGCTGSNFALIGAGAAGAAVCAAVAAAGLLNRRGDEEDSESWAKMSSGSSYGNKRMTTATQMSSFTRGGGAGDRSSRGSRSSRSSRSSKGKRMTGITQISGASRGEMMGFEGASAGSRATMGTVASQMSRATRSTSGSRNSRSSRGSRSSKGRSHASHGTRSSGSRNSRSSRGRH